MNIGNDGFTDLIRLIKEYDVLDLKSGDVSIDVSKLKIVDGSDDYYKNLYNKLGGEEMPAPPLPPILKSPTGEIIGF